MAKLKQIRCHYCRRILWSGRRGYLIKDHTCKGLRAERMRCAQLDLSDARKQLAELKKKIVRLREAVAQLGD